MVNFHCFFSLLNNNVNNKNKGNNNKDNSNNKKLNNEKKIDNKTNINGNDNTKKNNKKDKNTEIKSEIQNINDNNNSNNVNTIEVGPMTGSEIISYFWDYENCPISKQVDIFNLVKSIRALNTSNSREMDFICFTNTSNVPENVRISLHQSGVVLQDIPDKKPNAVDKAIYLAISKFQSLHFNRKATIGKGKFSEISKKFSINYW